uniref:Programmed cell death protein n=1 Tax=Rhabditophanes sp. KR3021 TaxID=114890 RepID=A0AC35THC7_9BILA
MTANKGQIPANIQMPEGMNGKNGPEMAQKMEEQKKMQNTMLSQILDQTAILRLNNVCAANPTKGAQIQNILVQMAQRGQITEKLNDEKFRQVLNQVSSSMETKEPKIKYDRGRNAIDSDSEDSD